jgi:hypothetical protein
MRWHAGGRDSESLTGHISDDSQHIMQDNATQPRFEAVIMCASGIASAASHLAPPMQGA